MSKDGQSEAKAQLQDQRVVLENLRGKANSTLIQIQEQQVLIHDVQSIVSDTREHTKSILATATDVLSLVTSGIVNLQFISQQLSRMFKLCTKFTREMREAMAELMRLFTNLHRILCRVENSLPIRIGLPIVQFTDALGETMALPYQSCRQWGTFYQLLRVVFTNKQGRSRVEMGQFLIMFAKGGWLLRETSWSDSVRENDHLSMSMVLKDLNAREGYCPYPTCQASLEGISIDNSGRTCKICGRWAVITSENRSSIHTLSYVPEPDVGFDGGHYRRWDFNSEELSRLVEQDEDVELYRQIHVSTTSSAILRKSGESSDSGYLHVCRASLWI